MTNQIQFHFAEIGLKLSIQRNHLGDPKKEAGRAREEFKLSSKRAPHDEVLFTGHQDRHSALERRRLRKYEAL